MHKITLTHVVFYDNDYLECILFRKVKTSFFKRTIVEQAHMHVEEGKDWWFHEDGTDADNASDVFICRAREILKMKLSQTRLWTKAARVPKARVIVR